MGVALSIIFPGGRPVRVVSFFWPHLPSSQGWLSREYVYFFSACAERSLLLLFARIFDRNKIYIEKNEKIKWNKSEMRKNEICFAAALWNVKTSKRTQLKCKKMRKYSLECVCAVDTGILILFSWFRAHCPAVLVAVALPVVVCDAGAVWTVVDSLY